MGREHILAKKRIYLMVQGTSSNFHAEKSLQVVGSKGEQGQGLGLKVPKR